MFVLTLFIAFHCSGSYGRSVLQDESSPSASPPAAESRGGCSVVINEVVHKPEDAGEVKGVDFVELYNPCDAEQDLTGWTLSDEDDTTFVMGQDGCTHTIGAQEYLVLFRMNPCSFEFGYTGIDRVRILASVRRLELCMYRRR